MEPIGAPESALEAPHGIRDEREPAQTLEVCWVDVQCFHPGPQQGVQGRESVQADRGGIRLVDSAVGSAAQQSDGNALEQAPKADFGLPGPLLGRQAARRGRWGRRQVRLLPSCHNACPAG